MLILGRVRIANSNIASVWHLFTVGCLSHCFLVLRVYTRYAWRLHLDDLLVVTSSHDASNAVVAMILSTTCSIISLRLAYYSDMVLGFFHSAAFGVKVWVMLWVDFALGSHAISELWWQTNWTNTSIRSILIVLSRSYYLFEVLGLFTRTLNCFTNSHSMLSSQLDCLFSGIFRGS